MHRSVFQRLGLCAPVTTDAPVTTSGAATPPATVAATTTEEKPDGEAEPPATPAASAAKPSIVDRAKALMKPKSTLQAEITQALSQVTSLTTERDQLRQQVQALTGQRDGLQLQLNQLQTLVDQAEQDNHSVQTEVIHQLAATGLPEASLPSISKAAHGTTPSEKFDALQSKIDDEKDPVKRGLLAEQQWEQFKAAQRGVGLN